MQWIDTHLMEITGVLAVAILLGVGRNKILPAVKAHRWLMWVAFAVTIVCGLMLGWALHSIVAWLTTLDGPFTATVGSIGALIAFTLGWHGVYLLIALIRDVADKTPDEAARKAALWIPTFLPAGFAAVWGVVSNPRGIGTGLTAAVMAGITIIYAHMIVKEALQGKTAAVGWKWFSAVVCLLVGVVMIPLVLYVDGVAADHMPGNYLLAARILAGVTGAAMLVAALFDIKDKQPDRDVRAFLRYGLPVLFVFGALTVGFFTEGTSNGGEFLEATFK